MPVPSQPSQKEYKKRREIRKEGQRHEIQNGIVAYLYGEKKSECPYKRGNILRRYWIKGWMKAWAMENTSSRRRLEKWKRPNRLQAYLEGWNNPRVRKEWVWGGDVDIYWLGQTERRDFEKFKQDYGVEEMLERKIPEQFKTKTSDVPYQIETTFSIKIDGLTESKLIKLKEFLKTL